MAGWILFCAFIGGFVGWAVVAKRKAMSGVVAYGGGFIAGVLMMLPAIGLLFVVLPKVEPQTAVAPVPVAAVPPAKPTPEPTQEPVIPKWNAEQTRYEAKKALKVIAEAEKDLQSAIETHDEPGFVQYVTRPLAKANQSWQEHYDNRDAFHYCDSALQNLHAYAMTFHQEYFAFSNERGVENRKSREFYLKLYEESKRECEVAVRRN